MANICPSTKRGKMQGAGWLLGWAKQQLPLRNTVAADRLAVNRSCQKNLDFLLPNLVWQWRKMEKKPRLTAVVGHFSISQKWGEGTAQLLICKDGQAILPSRKTQIPIIPVRLSIKNQPAPTSKDVGLLGISQAACPSLWERLFTQINRGKVFSRRGYEKSRSWWHAAFYIPSCWVGGKKGMLGI